MWVSLFYAILGLCVAEEIKIICNVLLEYVLMFGFRLTVGRAAMSYFFVSN